MLEGKTVTLIPLSSSLAGEFTGMLNRITWRDKWEIVRVKEVEKKIKDGKYGSEKNPLFIVRRSADDKPLGYISLSSNATWNYGEISAYADPGVELDENAWIEALELARDFLVGDLRIDRIAFGTVEGCDPLSELPLRLGFTRVGARRKARMVEGKLVDIIDYQYISDVPFPVTKVSIDDLSGEGGEAPDWREATTE